MTLTDMLIVLAVLAAWAFMAWRVHVEKGWVGIGAMEWFSLRLRAAMTRAADAHSPFGQALVALAPAARRVTAAMNDLYAAIERTASTAGSEGMCPTSSSTSGETRTTHHPVGPGGGDNVEWLTPDEHAERHRR